MIETPDIFEQMKVLIVDFTGLNADALHVYFGLVFFFLMAIPYRHRGLRWWMLLPTLIISILTEVLDRRYQLSLLGVWSWSQSVHDIVNTNLIPVVLYALLKWRRLPSSRPSAPLVAAESAPLPPESLR